MAVKTRPAELSVGDQAPEFDLSDETGARRRLADFRGKTAVLYFYPRDNTPGCTIEACEFRDLRARFSAKGAVILGVSPDAPASHLKFKDKFKLPFTLLCDPGKALCKAYGVWKEKAFMGRRFMGVERSTFVIGPDGKIEGVHRKVSAKGHPARVLESL